MSVKEAPTWVRIVKRRTPYQFPPVGALVEVRRWSEGWDAGRAMVDTQSGTGLHSLKAYEWEPATPPEASPPFDAIAVMLPRWFVIERVQSLGGGVLAIACAAALRGQEAGR